MEENEDDHKVINQKTEHEEANDHEEIDTQVENVVRVDLTRIKSGYEGKLHSQSNLPSVLNEYGMEEKENKYKENRKAHKERQPKKMAKEPEETDSKEKRRKKREERYSQLMEERQNMPEGSQYFSKKVSHMMTRLHTPREGSTHAVESEDSQKQERPISKRKMEKHILTTNSDYLKDMPKSDIAKIVELQDKLMKEGKLKTQYDIDKFREDIKKPEVFNSYFKNPKPSADTGSVVASTVTSLPKVPAPNPRSLSHIAEASRPPTREEWAVTHQFAPKYDEQTKAMTKKQVLSDIEKRFPKPLMPPLKCFSMDLGEKPPDPEEIQRQAELKVRIKQRKKFLRKLHRMHQMAMAHSAAASRIMENHGEIGGILDGNSLRDVISVLPAPEDQYISQQDVEVAEIGGQLMQDDHSRGSSSNGSFHSRASLHSRGSLASRGSQQSRGSKAASTPGLRRRIQSRESNRTKAAPLPLTMDEIRGKTKVIEAKCLSSNWMNYMKAGRNIETS